MKTVLPSIIHEDQTSFLKGRYIGENITLFLDVQEHLKKNLKPGLSFLADWEKAYDMVDRSFLYHSLSTFGFGSFFLRWFEVLHSQTAAKLTINAFLTELFPISCGVRQGCPLAPPSILMCYKTPCFNLEEFKN